MNAQIGNMLCLYFLNVGFRYTELRVLGCAFVQRKGKKSGKGGGLGSYVLL